MSAAIQSASSDPRGEGLEPDGRRGRVSALGLQPLGDAGADLEAVRVVEPDEPVGRIEDRAERSIVPSQHDGPCARVARLEVEDVVDRRAAERVDRLVVITDDGHVAMRLGKQRHELRLGPVRVLELVHEDVPEAARDGRPGRRRLAHESEGQRDLIAEVDEPVRGQQLLVAGKRPRELCLPAPVFRQRRRALRSSEPSRRELDGVRCDALGVRHVGSGGDVLVLATAEQRCEGTQEAGRVTERPVLVELELVQVLAQEDDDLGARQDADIGRQAELERVLADEPVAERVERRDRGIRVAVRDELVDAHGHLGSRLVREGQRQDLRRLGAS